LDFSLLSFWLIATAIRLLEAMRILLPIIRQIVANKKFVSNFFDIIKKFNGKKLDTTILTIGNLVGDLDQDTIFAIGVVYGPPDFHAPKEVDSSAFSLVYDQGVDDLNRAGIHVDKEQYRAYLRDFKGDLLAYGQPESREGLYIWYKPARRMITYYHP